MSDIKSGISDPSVRTMLLFATCPWMGRRTHEQTPSGPFKHVLNTSLHGLMELDHWHVMDMMDLEHDDVPNGRFMALYKRREGHIELLQVLQPGHKRNVHHHDLAVLFFAPTPEEYVGAEQVSLKDAPKLRKPTTDHMFSNGKLAAGEMNLLANQIGLAWKRKLQFY